MILNNSMQIQKQLKKVRAIIFGLGFIIALSGTAAAQSVALKTNLLYWATTTPNIGLEFKLSPRFTLDVSGGFNPFKFEHNRKLQHWTVSPELRYWTCDAFNGHFFGLHGTASSFNVNDIDFPLGRLKVLNDYRYQGWLVGGGLTYGYQVMLGKKFNLELSISGGYAYIDYEKYECVNCGKKIGEGVEHYLGVTKATLSLIYLIN